MKSKAGDLQCPCCKDCKDCTTGFQKVVDLKNAGLVIYRHTTKTEDVNKNTGKIEFATKTTEDVFILHNTKDMDITSADCLPEIERSQINCPRCRRIIEHAQKLLQKVPTINRNDVKGICEHCRMKDAPCFECEEVVKKFMASNTERDENTKERVKLWLSKIKYLLKDALVDATETGNERARAYSELYIDQLCRRASPEVGREPKVKQMFHPAHGSHFVGAIPPSIEKRNKMFTDFPQLEKVERPLVYLDASRKYRKSSSFQTKAIYKADQDHYYSDPDSEDLRAMFYSPVTKQDPQKQKKDKHVELREHVPPVPFHSEEDFAAGRDESMFDHGLTRRLTCPKSRYASDEELYSDLKPNRNQTPELNKKFSLGASKAEKKYESPVVVRKYHSEEALLTTVGGVTKDVLKQGFTYFFPKALPPDKKLKRQKSSSELIKDTQDMLLARAEQDKKKLEEECKRKIEEEERKNLAREAKKKTDKEEKKRLKTKPEIKDVKLTQIDKEKAKKEKITPTASTATSKSQPVPDKKASKLKPGLNEPKPPKEPKIDKDALKAEKDAEKAQKEKEKKEKDAQIKKDKEEKERLKKEKEEQLRKDKELKQKEKDMREREKEEQKREKGKDKQKENEQSKLRAEKEAADKKAREDARLQLKMARDADAQANSEPEKPKIHKNVEEPKTKELNIKQIKVKKPSIDRDNLLLNLVKMRQSKCGDRVRPKHLSDLNLAPKAVKKHMDNHKLKQDTCIICLDSELEFDAESIFLKKDESPMAEIIKGERIFKYKPPLLENRGEQIVPLVFQSTFDEATALPLAEPVDDTEISPREKKSPKSADQDVPKGVIRYALSDRSFIDKGWTMLPTEKVVRKMNVYRMRPAHPEFDWFEHNKNKRLMSYDSGEKLAEFDDNGRGRWFYRSGRLALDYYDAAEMNAQQRFVIYSSGEPDERGRSQPFTILATFDYLGNGIVFDHSGKIRLKYNQTEGVVLDRSIGPVSHWKWHTLNDPPVLQQVMIDTELAHKDPAIMKLGGPLDNKTRPDNEDMLAIEFDNFIKEKSKKLSQTFKPFQIKMKALKINEHFSLKVLDQATVYLIYRDGTTNLKLNIGMVLDHKEIVDTDSAEVSEVSNNLERLPARTDSLAELQRNIAHAQHFARTRTERECRLRPPGPTRSADKLTAAASRPLRPPFRTGPSSTTTNCRCSRKSTTTNVYYDTRLF